MSLIINEIFHSIQGESTTAGFPCLFIRLTGCNLNCAYCDTEYAKNSGEKISIEDILKRAGEFKKTSHITITGGEPLLQEESITLMKNLLQNGYEVQLETNGSISLRNVPREVRKIVDVKTPSSGEENSFLIENLDYINNRDEIKFVISDTGDYNFSKKFIKNNRIVCTVNFSPVFEKLSPEKLAGLILVDRLPVRLNLQLHKIIWPGGEPEGRQKVK